VLVDGATCSGVAPKLNEMLGNHAPGAEFDARMT
jgi:hypothetical protein